MNISNLWLAASAILVLACAPQPAAADASTIDRQARTDAIERASLSLRERYIFPEVGDRAAAHIEERAAAGAYDDLSTAEAFAAELTTDLQSITNDKHLRATLKRTPRASGGSSQRPVQEGGVVRADILPNNIGYLELSGFHSVNEFRPSIDRAMAALEGVSAVIIDLRRNGGGDPQSVSYLVSHFLEGTAPVHVNDFVTRIHGTTEETVEEFWSSETPTSLHGARLYVLTSARTFSAAEEFSYDIKVMNLGKTVGETTGGGANPGDIVEIGSGIELFVPDGRARNPITRTNWEGVGVQPDIEAPKEKALTAALQQLGLEAASEDIETLSLKRVFTPKGG